MATAKEKPGRHKKASNGKITNSHSSQKGDCGWMAFKARLKRKQHQTAVDSPPSSSSSDEEDTQEFQRLLSSQSTPAVTGTTALATSVASRHSTAGRTPSEHGTGTHERQRHTNVHVIAQSCNKNSISNISTDAKRSGSNQISVATAVTQGVNDRPLVEPPSHNRNTNNSSKRHTREWENNVKDTGSSKPSSDRRQIATTTSSAAAVSSGDHTNFVKATAEAASPSNNSSQTQDPSDVSIASSAAIATSATAPSLVTDMKATMTTPTKQQQQARPSKRRRSSSSSSLNRQQQESPPAADQPPALLPSTVGSKGEISRESKQQQPIQWWKCGTCTFENAKQLRRCGMCNTRRPVNPDWGETDSCPSPTSTSMSTVLTSSQSSPTKSTTKPPRVTAKAKTVANNRGGSASSTKRKQRPPPEKEASTKTISTTVANSATSDKDDSNKTKVVATTIQQQRSQRRQRTADSINNGHRHQHKTRERSLSPSNDTTTIENTTTTKASKDTERSPSPKKGKDWQQELPVVKTSEQKNRQRAARGNSVSSREHEQKGGGKVTKRNIEQKRNSTSGGKAVPEGVEEVKHVTPPTIVQQQQNQQHQDVVRSLENMLRTTNHRIKLQQQQIALQQKQVTLLQKRLAVQQEQLARQNEAIWQQQQQQQQQHQQTNKLFRDIHIEIQQSLASLASPTPLASANGLDNIGEMEAVPPGAITGNAKPTPRTMRAPNSPHHQRTSLSSPPNDSGRSVDALGQSQSPSDQYYAISTEEQQWTQYMDLDDDHQPINQPPPEHNIRKEQLQKLTQRSPQQESNPPRSPPSNSRPQHQQPRQQGPDHITSPCSQGASIMPSMNPTDLAKTSLKSHRHHQTAPSQPLLGSPESEHQLQASQASSATYNTIDADAHFRRVTLDNSHKKSINEGDVDDGKESSTKNLSSDDTAEVGHDAKPPDPMPVVTGRSKLPPLLDSTNCQQHEKAASTKQKPARSTTTPWISNRPARQFVNEMDSNSNKKKMMDIYRAKLRCSEATTTNESTNNDHGNNSIIENKHGRQAPSSTWVSAKNRRRSNFGNDNNSADPKTDIWEEDGNEKEQSDQPDYAYKEVVRTKAAREALPSHDCECCRKFYDLMRRTGHDDWNSQHIHECSRHRAKFAPAETPVDFWELDFIDEMKAKKTSKTSLGDQ